MLAAANGTPVNYGNLMVDGLALYGRALTAAQVAAHRTAALADSAPAPAPVPSGYVGGIALGALQPWNARRGADFKAMGDAHATWVRSDLGWMYLEPTRGSTPARTPRRPVFT